MRIDDESRGLQNVAFFLVPAAQRLGDGGTVYAVEQGKIQFQLVGRALRFIEGVGRESVDRDALGGGCVQVSLEIS